MDDVRHWPALVIAAARLGLDDLIVATLDSFSPAAIEDLVPQPLPPGGLWDPTCPPPPEPPPSPVHWRVVFNTPGERDGAASALAAQLPDLRIEPVEIPDENWAARSQRELTAVRAGSFIVAPPWDVPAHPESGSTIIVIEPSRGFGTGHHASTRLCLRALSKIDVRGARVLDLGTGSGVLAMAAAFRGAREVLAVDIDRDAIDAARESAALNRLPIAVEWRVADFRAGLPGAPYDLVLANLTGGMLIASAAVIMSLVAPEGTLVASGFDDTERDSVRQSFGPMRDRASLEESGWGGLVLTSSQLI